MATQYTAGIVQGQNWTAAIANQIGAAWETWTPTITTTAGTITTGALIQARYARIQKIVIGRLFYQITTAGTAAGTLLNFTLPITANSTYGNGHSIGFGREASTSGQIQNVYATSTTTAQVANYLGGGWIQNTTSASINFFYEAA